MSTIYGNSFNRCYLKIGNNSPQEVTEIKYQGNFYWRSGRPAIYDTVKNATGNITEAQWLEFINQHCISLARNLNDTASFIGKNVTLDNSIMGTYNSWKIADINHDNSGNTADLIQNNVIDNKRYSYATDYYVYRDSYVREYILACLDYFSTAVKNKLTTMTIVTADNYLNPLTLNDKIKLLSVKEVGLTAATLFPSDDGSSTYPIFTDNIFRVRDGAYVYWWLRSTDGSRFGTIGPQGTLGFGRYDQVNGIVPCIRFAG